MNHNIRMTTTCGTQNLFLAKLTRMQVNELLHRASNKSLENIINTSISHHGYYAIVNLYHTLANNEISLYINIFQKNTNYKILHFTLHFSGRSSVRSGIHMGSLHVKNNIKAHIWANLRVCGLTINGNNGIRFEIETYHFEPIKANIINDIINIFNNYFSLKSTSSLLHISNTTVHPFLQHIPIIQSNRRLRTGGRHKSRQKATQRKLTK